MNKKLIILLTVFIDVLGLGIIIPIMPFYVAQFSTSPIIITALFAVFAACAFFSAPFLGALSDKIGRRPVLIISIFSSALGWLMFAWAPSLIFLFVGRIIDGLAAGNFSIAQGYLSDISKTPKERTANMGLIGAIFGVGLIIGPALGGLLSLVSLSFPFWIVAGLAFINFVSAILFLPETNQNKQVDKKIEFNPFLPISRSFRNKNIQANLIAWVLFGLGISLLQAIMALYLARAFGLSAHFASYIFTFTGVLLVINQGFLLQKFWLKKFNERYLQSMMLIVFTIGFMIVSIKYLWVFIIGLILTTFGQSLLRAVMTSEMLKKVDDHRHGEILGVNHSLMSLTLIIGPLLAGWLFNWQMTSPFWLGAILMFVAYLALKIKKDRYQKQNLDLEINTEELYEKNIPTAI